MKPCILTQAAGLTLLVACTLPAVADAADIRVRCESRASPARAKISVDGSNVAANAMFTARVTSGTGVATSAPRTAAGDEVEFDFDSNWRDVRAGATRISPAFISANAVRAVLLNADGQVVAGPTAASCRAR